MRKSMFLLLLVSTLLFAGCTGIVLLAMFEGSNSKKMQRKLYKKGTWEITSLRITEIENYVTVRDTTMFDPGYFYFEKKKDDNAPSSYISRMGKLVLNGQSIDIYWRAYSTDDKDETPSLLVWFTEDLEHFEGGKDYGFSNRVWNWEDLLHLEWGEGGKIGNEWVYLLQWELVLKAKD